MSGQKIKCLAIIVNRNKGEQITELCWSYRPYFTYGIPALGTTGSDLLDYLGIGKTDKELLFCRLPAQLEHEVMHRIAKETQIRKMGHGIMSTMPLGGVSDLFQRKILCGRIYEEEEIEQRGRKYELAIVVVEHGWHDQIMEATKGANATDGMAPHACSLYEDGATPFLGIKLQGEKGIAVILSVYKNYKQIMYEINMVAGFQTEAKGLVFSTPVDELIGMQTEKASAHVFIQCRFVTS